METINTRKNFDLGAVGDNMGNCCTLPYDESDPNKELVDMSHFMFLRVIGQVRETTRRHE